MIVVKGITVQQMVNIVSITSKIVCNIHSLINVSGVMMALLVILKKIDVGQNCVKILLIQFNVILLKYFVVQIFVSKDINVIMMTVNAMT